MDPWRIEHGSLVESQVCVLQGRNGGAASSATWGASLPVEYEWAAACPGPSDPSATAAFTPFSHGAKHLHESRSQGQRFVGKWENVPRNFVGWLDPPRMVDRALHTDRRGLALHGFARFGTAVSPAAVADILDRAGPAIPGGPHSGNTFLSCSKSPCLLIRYEPLLNVSVQFARRCGNKPWGDGSPDCDIKNLPRPPAFRDCDHCHRIQSSNAIGLSLT